jgi:hypothetical protein
MNLLKAALHYEKMGFCVIPVKPNKKPYVKWEKYQTEKATDTQLQEWWQKWPGANVGVVTGEISGIMVVDADSKAGFDALNDFLPDSLLIPTVKTKKGHHLWFEYRKGLANKVRPLTDCDIRTDGGYIVAPPSNNGECGHSWMPGLKITDLTPAPMPDMLFDVLQQGAHATRSLERNIIRNDPYTKKGLLGGVTFLRVTFRNI